MSGNNTDNKISEGLEWLESLLDNISRDMLPQFDEDFRMITDFINNRMREYSIVNETYSSRLEYITLKYIPIHSREMYVCSSQLSFDAHMSNLLDTYEKWIHTGMVYTKYSTIPKRLIPTDINMRSIIYEGILWITKTFRLAEYLELTISPEYMSRAEEIEELITVRINK